jgi:hypothetical protein
MLDHRGQQIRAHPLGEVAIQPGLGLLGRELIHHLQGDGGLDRAHHAQQPVVAAHIERTRRRAAVIRGQVGALGGLVVDLALDQGQLLHPGAYGRGRVLQHGAAGIAREAVQRAGAGQACRVAAVGGQRPELGAGQKEVEVLPGEVDAQRAIGHAGRLARECGQLVGGHGLQAGRLGTISNLDGHRMREKRVKV